MSKHEPLRIVSITYNPSLSQEEMSKSICDQVPEGWVLHGEPVHHHGTSYMFVAPPKASQIPSPEIAAAMQESATDGLLQRIDMLTDKWKECAIENESLRKRLAKAVSEVEAMKSFVPSFPGSNPVSESLDSISKHLDQAELMPEKTQILLLQTMLRATNEARAKCEHADRETIQKLERDLKYAQDANSKLSSQLTAMKASNDNNIHFARVLENRLLEIRAVINRPPDESVSTATAGR